MEACGINFLVTGHWSEGALVRNLTLTLTLRLYNFRTGDPSDQWPVPNFFTCAPYFR